MQTVLKDAESRMGAALEALGREFATVRTGRASTGLLDGIRVDYYGTPTPLNQMASVSVLDARTLTIQPWEASQLKAIEDRKSTRLNSSHSQISYAVFCLKKKNSRMTPLRPSL